MFRYVLANSLDSGCFCTVKNNQSCACRNAMALLENVQSVLYHALELLLYYCTSGTVFAAMNIVSLVTI